MNLPTKILVSAPLFLATATPTLAVSQNPFLLPNNPLYLFKYSIDQIRISFTTNPVSKAELYQQLAKDKLNEAYSLAAINQNDLAKQAIFEYQQYSKQSTELASSNQNPTEKSDKILSQIAEDSAKNNITLSRTESLLPEDLKVYIAEAIESNNKNQTKAIQGMSANELQALEQKIKTQKEALNQQILAAEKEIRAKKAAAKITPKIQPLSKVTVTQTAEPPTSSITELSEQQQYLEELVKTIEEAAANQPTVTPTPTAEPTVITTTKSSNQQTTDNNEEEKETKNKDSQTMQPTIQKESGVTNQAQNETENDDDNDNNRSRHNTVRRGTGIFSRTNTIMVQGASTTNKESLISKLLKFLKIN